MHIIFLLSCAFFVFSSLFADAFIRVLCIIPTFIETPYRRVECVVCVESLSMTEFIFVCRFGDFSSFFFRFVFLVLTTWMRFGWNENCIRAKYLNPVIHLEGCWCFFVSFCAVPMFIMRKYAGIVNGNCAICEIAECCEEKKKD